MTAVAGPHPLSKNPQRFAVRPYNEMMQIEFTQHALARMKERGIS